jgi:GNAT superfamily N-acetyltransferase
MSIRITQENPRQSVPQTLLGELSAEIAALYPYEDDGGTGGFHVEDVEVPRAAFVVAWDEDEPVGCGALRPMTAPDTVEVKRMYVRKAARGRKISRQILKHLEQLAREFGYRMVRLETGILQPEAIALYESCGYQRVVCYEPYEDLPDFICYEKML